MTIRYDYDLETLKFWNDNSIDEDNQNYLMLLEDEQIITWSDYNCSERNFTTFWSEGLVIISKKNSSTSVNEPMLIWGPYDGFQPSGYKIYWRTGGFGNFSLLATTNAHTYSFVHEGFTFGGISAEYKIQAYNSSSTSPFTNTINTNVSAYKNSNDPGRESQNAHRIFNSFPNPFNPSTTLSYELKSDEYVSIKIYDSIGRLVKNLLNIKQSKGSHSIKWHGDSDGSSKLGSGIYFIMINIGTATEFKKVILIK